MKAIMVSGYGGADVLKLSESEPVPKPGTGQVLLKIHAALEEAAQAHRVLEGRQSMGKIILKTA